MVKDRRPFSVGRLGVASVGVFFVFGRRKCLVVFSCDSDTDAGSVRDTICLNAKDYTVFAFCGKFGSVRSDDLSLKNPP